MSIGPRRGKVVAIIQARLGSTRLPGKVLLDLAGEPMLARVVDRTRRAQTLDDVVVATTVQPADDVITHLCAERGWPCFRGSEEDVLDRYYRAAQAHQADVVVRITSDCPFIDPGVVDKVVSTFLDAKADYASNCLERTYPRGLDTEVMTRSALERAWRQATQHYQRVHVTPYLHQNPDLFRLLSVTNDRDYSHYRWTVDTPEDLAFIRTVYERLGNDDTVEWTDVLVLLEREPALTELNRAVQQKALHEG